MQKYLATSLSALLLISPAVSPVTADAQSDYTHTSTPIKHVVVIFGENVSFDQYFGTYPYGAKPS